MTRPLIRRPRHTNPGELEGRLHALAAAIEDALLAGGAEPARDYWHIDVYRMALPFLLEDYRRGSLTIPVGWPPDLYDDGAVEGPDPMDYPEEGGA